MKYLIILLFVVFSDSLYGQTPGNIQISGVKDFRYLENTQKGSLYAIQKRTADEPASGQVIFTPGNGSGGWEVKWTYEGGVEREGVYNADSSQITVDLIGDGEYIFQAQKQGFQVREQFYVFYDYLEMNVSYTNRFDCENITINITYPFLPDDQKIMGNIKMDYWVVWGGKERQLSSSEVYYKEISQRIMDDSEDVTFRIRIKDRFGLYWESNEDIYESVIPKAVAELELGNTVHVVGEVNDEMGQAPLEVAFYSSSSVNAGSYQWLLYKDTASMTDDLATTLTDSLLNEQIRTSPEFSYTYENTGRYKVRLIAINSLGKHCTDTTAPLYVNVVESLVDVPNVFTPNGDGKNDIFKVQALSVEEFRAVILNRWGRKLHEWTDPREGWDGRVNGKLANPGTYFYIVTARGREKINPPEYVKKGALMLIR